MLDRMLSPHLERIYALFRIVLGLCFAQHGAQKMFGVLGGHVPAFGSQMWVGGVIELVGGVLIALGFFTRWAAFVSSGTMAVAYTQFHWKLQLGSGFFPVVNKGEVALVYAFAFLFIAARGPGIFSLDRGR